MRPIDVRERGPDSNSQKSDGPENRSQSKAGQHFTAHDAPPIAHVYFTKCRCADDQRGRLRARVASTGDDKRNKQRENNRLLHLAFEESHGRRSQPFSKEQDDEPSRLFFTMREMAICIYGSSRASEP